jgi:RNA polymerase primary sigma factor
MIPSSEPTVLSGREWTESDAGSDAMGTMTAKRLAAHSAPPKVMHPVASVMDRFSQRDRDLISKALSEPAEYVAHPSFRKAAIEQLLFPRERDEPARTLSDILDSPNCVQAALSTMTAEEERLAFRRYNYARYRVYLILKHHHLRRLSLTGSRDLVFWQRRALTARTTIVQANLPLVLAMAKRTRLNGVDFNELISEGNMALLRSVGKFDCSRGFKFSTYACRAILKSFSRVALRTTRYRGRFPTEFDPTLEKSDFIETKRQTEHGQCMDELRNILNANLAGLNEIEWTVINSRFALNGSVDEKPAPKTLEEVGEIIGVTKERVRQIQNKALRKLRAALEENMVAA